MMNIMAFDPRASSTLEVAKYFFNSISPSRFLDVIDRLYQGIGFGDGYNGCVFPEDQDLDKEPFQGVLFYMLDDEIVVGAETFDSLLREACEGYAKLFPEEKLKINQVLTRNGRKVI